MKKKTLSLFTLAVLLAYATGGCGPNKPPLHRIKDGEKILLEIKLRAGGKHEFVVPAAGPVFLSLSTDASFKAMRKYASNNPLPVRLEHLGRKQALSTVQGAGGTFVPVNGAVPLRLVNETDEELQILVFCPNN